MSKNIFVEVSFLDGRKIITNLNDIKLLSYNGKHAIRVSGCEGFYSEDLQKFSEKEYDKIIQLMKNTGDLIT